MTKTEFSRVVLVAQKVPLDELTCDVAMFDGYGLPDFEPICATLQACAYVLRWQCLYFMIPKGSNDWWDNEEMERTWRAWRTKVTLVGDGSDDTASLPGRLLAKALLGVDR